MVKKKGTSIVSSTNELVKAFSMNTESDFILNPVSYTQIRGNFSLAQTNLMIGIIAQLQDRIKEQLTFGETNFLFKPEDFSGNLLNFEIPLKELGISPKKYGELEAACEALLHVDMSYKRFDEKENIEYNVKQNIFHKIEFPTNVLNAEGEKVGYKSGQRRKGVIKIQMVDESAREILNLRKGYTRHLKNICSFCRSPRTPRLYIYLTAWRKIGSCTVNYIDLKEFFGVLTFSKDHKRITENRYLKYGAFHRDVLDPVQKEMKNLSDENKVEFYFEYEPIYPHGVSRGDPESIRFHLIESQFGKSQLFQNYKDKLRSELITKYHLQPMEWERLSALMYEGMDIREAIRRIDKILEEKQPDNVHAYVTAILCKWLEEHPRPTPQPATIDDVLKDNRETHPYVDPTMRKKWEWWMEQCRLRLGDEFYNTFMKECSDIWAIRDKQIIVAVPNDFVKDRWEERIAEVSSYFFTAFGKDKRLNYIYIDLSQVCSE